MFCDYKKYIIVNDEVDDDDDDDSDSDFEDEDRLVQIL